MENTTLPKEYVDGYTIFIDQKIDLAKRPLIPRPETEYWVDKFIKDLGDESGSVLDLFSGSGCIGIAVAKHCPKTSVTLADKTNYVTTPLSSNCKFIESDIFANLEGKYDFILANPPYVPIGKGADPDKKGENVMDFEPQDALYAGLDGLSVIKPFLEQALKHLNEHGQIWMEFGTGQKGEVTDLLRTYGYYDRSSCTFHRDQYSKWRYLIVKT